MEKMLWPKVNWRIYSAVPEDLNSTQLLVQILEARVLDSMSQAWSITVTRRNNENQKLWSVLPWKGKTRSVGAHARALHLYRGLEASQQKWDPPTH